MNRAVYALASGGLAAQARLDAVTQNLANVGTAGYKAARPVFRLNHDYVMRRGGEGLARLLGTELVAHG